MKPSKIILGLTKIPLDFTLGILAFLSAYQIRSKTDLIPGIQLPLDLETFPPINDYLTFGAIATCGLILLFAVNGLYSIKTRSRFGQETGKILMISLAWLMLIITWFFIVREFPFSRLVLGYSWIITFIYISAGRGLIRMIEFTLLKANIGKEKVIFIGDGNITETLAKTMKKDSQFKIAGLLANNLHNTTGIKHLGKVSDLEKIVKKFKIDEVIQTKSDLSSATATDILEFCREHHLQYSFVPDILSLYHSNIEIETISGIPIINLKPTPLDGWGRILKRAFDLFGAIIGMIIISPILLVTAIAIKLDSKGTIFFKYLDDGNRVKRVGQQGRLFNFYKFRTMYPNSHNRRYTDLAEENTRKGSPLVKIKNDPRVTKVGKFLRKSSIDELPQLFNVIKGEMSLVGPRPHLPEEVANYKKQHKFVLTIKPGITGMAQISGRSDLDFEEEMQLDTYYIEHWSPWMDIIIILKTIGVLIKGYNE